MFDRFVEIYKSNYSFFLSIIINVHDVPLFHTGSVEPALTNSLVIVLFIKSENDGLLLIIVA